MNLVLEFLYSKITLGNLIAVGLLSLTILITVFTTFIASSQIRSFQGLWAHLIPSGIFSHPSVRADFIFYATKRLLKLVWLFPAGLSAVSIGVVVHRGLMGALAIDQPPSGPGSPWLVALFTVSMLLTHDFSYYLYHRALHQFPALWEFHKVHHSAEQMVGTTDERTHPIDDLMFYTWEGLVVGILFGVWMFFLPNLEVVIFGLNAVLLSKILSFGYARHLPYKLSFGWLNGFLNCPHYHQLHHSTNPEHFDKNFGLNLIIWDRLFGTVAIPKPDEDFTYGLGTDETKEYYSVFRLYSLPLINLTAMARQKLAAMGRRKLISLNPAMQPNRSAALDLVYLQAASTTSASAGEAIRLVASYSMGGSTQYPDMVGMNS